MEIRKFEAFSMQEAIKLVKKELGSDAVILSTKEREERLPTAAGHGSAKGRIVEVLAARGGSKTHAPEPRTETRSAPSDVTRPSPETQWPAGARARTNVAAAESERARQAQSVVFPRVETPRETVIVKGSPVMSSLGERTAQKLRQAATATVPGPAGASAVSGAHGPVTTKPVSPAANPAAAKRGETFSGKDALLQRAADVAGLVSTDEILVLREELTQMRKDLERMPQINFGDQMQEIKILLHSIMRDTQTKQAEGAGARYEYLTNLAVRLRSAGLAEVIVSKLMSDVAASVGAREKADGRPLENLNDALLGAAVKSLLAGVRVTGPFLKSSATAGLPAQAGLTLLALVGPTGVGKTTTVAKLAARLKLDEGKRVALASMDTFRLAAADQLRVYAKILDCPFAEVANERELAEFAQKNHQADVLLIDTAGRAARAEGQLDSLRGLRDSPLPVEFHLVLPANMRLRDLEENAKAFKFLSPSSLLFTKLDESWSFGEIVSACMLSRLPLSYFSTGQRVPEDLELASKEKVVERLFRF